jgi:hypothetical protein
MSMKRTIFEIPKNLQQISLSTLEKYSISYSQRMLANNTLEIEITHHKSQNYLIELIERELNLFAELEFQKVS